MEGKERVRKGRERKGRDRQVERHRNDSVVYSES
jgi:hypothetical protein